MTLRTWLPFACCLVLPTAAHAVEPATWSEKYKAMSQKCRDVENSLRKSPEHVPSANTFYLRSEAQCDYRGDDPAQWRG